MTAPPFSTEQQDLPATRLSGAVQLAALISLAVFERVLVWGQRPPDMKLFLEPWFSHLVHWGPVEAFAHPFSNYAPAYLYLLSIGSLAGGLLSAMEIIKIMSVLGTLFLTAAVADLLKASGVDWRRALLVLVLPSVAINDGLLAQCDALWAGASILALASMVRGRTLAAMLWCGLAISFKAQAAFMAPVIIGAMIGRRAPLWQWAVPAAVYLASVLPAFLMGWPLEQLLTVYLHQASADQLAGRLANPWMFFTILGEESPRSFFIFGYVAAGLAALAIGALAARNARNAGMLILLAALAGTALPFLLPKMLERYYFLGEVMTLALVLHASKTLSRFAFIAVQAASLLGHVTYVYFFYEPWPALVGAGFAAAGLGALCVLAPIAESGASKRAARAGQPIARSYISI